ncbi:hypothetical protein PsW64_03186 [Pseudovibrio sp. W64]|uniref:PP2C family serine/threonine-protein phosphatase n=1 Tax=Pseudovibrio sp. W64 TaxID=1735583 RepID=UPI0007AEBAE5|nr:PP2C family serine/threonine-protein phosphatase [Pseudovibrio sp. W64]KZK79089.1 hypothetical protein PsW64_03186 [Pseudovibrio sp. W64]
MTDNKLPPSDLSLAFDELENALDELQALVPPVDSFCPADYRGLNSAEQLLLYWLYTQSQKRLNAPELELGDRADPSEEIPADEAPGPTKKTLGNDQPSMTKLADVLPSHSISAVNPTANELGACEPEQPFVVAPNTIEPSSDELEPGVPQEPTHSQNAETPKTDGTVEQEPDTQAIEPQVVADTENKPPLGKPIDMSRIDQIEISVRNAREDQAYSQPIEGFSELTLEDDAGTGFELTSEGVLSGIPRLTGSVTLRLRGLKGERETQINARVSIIPDPRKIWMKSIASDQTAVFAKPDTDFGSAVGDAFVAGASVRGRSHAIKGGYRDDDFKIQTHGEGGWHFMVACDGAGSAQLSREGSRLAAETVLEALPSLTAKHIDPNLDEILAAYLEHPESVIDKIKNKLIYPVLPDAALKAANVISEVAESHNRPATDYYTTILIAISRKVGEHWFTATFTIGDGGIVIVDMLNESVRPLCLPDSGEFAGQTRFLMKSEFSDARKTIDRIFVDVRKEFTALAIMTDGITDPLFPTDKALADPANWAKFWYENFGKAVKLSRDNTELETEFIDWMGFFSKGNHDDRTMIVLVPEDCA